MTATSGSGQLVLLLNYTQKGIPAGSQPGDVITLRKRGLPQIGGGRLGHQHIQLFLEIPKKLTPEQRELLDAYAKTENANVTPKRKSFLNTLKQCFDSLKK